MTEPDLIAKSAYWKPEAMSLVIQAETIRLIGKGIEINLTQDYKPFKRVIVNGHEYVLDESKESQITPVSSLDLSVRTARCLKLGGVETIEQLLNMTYWDLLKIRNMGKRSAEEIKKRLEANGMYLKEDRPRERNR